MAVQRTRWAVGLLVPSIALVFAVSSHAGGVNYTYDDAGRLVRADYGAGGVIEYTYDAAGNRISKRVVGPAPAPDIEVDPPSHNFGGVEVGKESAAREFTVSNAGTEDLVIGAVSITGTNADCFRKGTDDCSTQTVAPGGSCVVDVVFRPCATGAETATLSIPSNDPDENPELANLTGTGLPPPGSCAGDCDGGGTVTVNELIQCVNIALGNQPVSSCPDCDPGGDGDVTVDELVKAVNAALSGCPV